MGFFPKDTTEICAQAAGVTLTGLRKDERILGPTIVLMKNAGTIYERISNAVNEREWGKPVKPPAVTSADCERLYHKWKNLERSKEFATVALHHLDKEQERRTKALEASGKQGWDTRRARDPESPFPRRKSSKKAP